MAWIGDNDEVLRALEEVGASKDEAGRFLLRGDLGPVTFMGAGEEVVIHESMHCQVGDEWKEVVPLLKGGVAVKVI